VEAGELREPPMVRMKITEAEEMLVPLVATDHLNRIDEEVHRSRHSESSALYRAPTKLVRLRGSGVDGESSRILGRTVG
jgi:hypothetical protein